MPRLLLPPEQLTGRAGGAGGRAAQVPDPRAAAGGRRSGLTMFDGQGQEVEARIEAMSARTTDAGAGRAPLAVRRPRARRSPCSRRSRRANAWIWWSRRPPSWAWRASSRSGQRARWCSRAATAACAAGAPSPRRPPASAAAPTSRRSPSPVRWPRRWRRTPRPARRRLLLWEESSGAPLRRALTGNETAVHLLVGAEGGFTAEEAKRRPGRRVSGRGPGPAHPAHRDRRPRRRWPWCRRRWARSTD